MSDPRFNPIVPMQAPEVGPEAEEFYALLHENRWMFPMQCDLGMDMRHLGPGRAEARFEQGSDVAVHYVRWSWDQLEALVDYRHLPGEATLVFPEPYQLQIHLTFRDRADHFECDVSIVGLRALTGTVHFPGEARPSHIVGCTPEAVPVEDDGSFYLELPGGTECGLSVAVRNGFAVAISEPVPIRMDGDVGVDLFAVVPDHEPVPWIWYVDQTLEMADRMGRFIGWLDEHAEIADNPEMVEMIDELEAQRQDLLDSTVDPTRQVPEIP